MEQHRQVIRAIDAFKSIGLKEPEQGYIIHKYNSMLDYYRKNCGKTREKWYVVTYNGHIDFSNGPHAENESLCTIFKSIEDIPGCKKELKNMSNLNMKYEYYSFVVYSPEISKAIQTIAFNNGWKWSYYGKVISNIDKPVLSFVPRTHDIYSSHIEELKDIKRFYTIETLGELMEFLSTKYVKDININGQTVVFNEDKSIKVGRTTVDYNTMKEIWNKVNQ